MWILTALLLTAAPPQSGSEQPQPPSSPPSVCIVGDARRATSASFDVSILSARHDARCVARDCEAWRTRLHEFWRGGTPAKDWTPRCQVVVHGTRTSYLAAVGRGGAQSEGTSWIEFGPTGLKARRIDVLAEGNEGLSPLPHEMTHVLLAGLLGCQPPRWIDEGVAILADSPEKQTLHYRDLREGLQQRHAFRCGELMTLDDYPAPHRVPAFYGQSASLVTFLAKRDTPARFLAFTERAMSGGYDRALREVYEIDGVAELERLWYVDHVAQANAANTRLADDRSPTTLSGAE